MLHIVTDNNIPYLPECFNGIATVTALPGKALSHETVREADLLFTRSTVKIGPSLLEGSKVRFVGTATIGTDHVDFDYLNSRNIAFASAPGSNANSVAEWFVVALLRTLQQQQQQLAGLTVGVVGHGNVGSKVARNARVLGANVLCCDPPLARQDPSAGYVSLETLLPQVDVLTLHVPLEKQGIDKTVGMIDEAQLARLKPGAIVLNAARGHIIVEQALRAAVDAGHVTTLLDVWENEPVPSPETIKRARLASPHIAGHSFDGKLNGTEMMYRAACEFLQITPNWQPARFLPPTTIPTLDVRHDKRDDEDLILAALEALYQIEVDDIFMREIAALPPEIRGSRFSGFRNQYRMRREARHTTVYTERKNLAETLERIGFQVR